MSAPCVRESSPDAPPIAPLLDYCCHLATANFLFFSIALNSKKVAPALPSDVTPSIHTVRGRSLRRTSWILLLIITLQSVAFAIAPAGAEHAQAFDTSSISSNASDCASDGRTGEVPHQGDRRWHCGLACCSGGRDEVGHSAPAVPSHIILPAADASVASPRRPERALPSRVFELARSWSSRAPPSSS